MNINMEQPATAKSTPAPPPDPAAPWVSVVMPIHSCRVTIGKALDSLHRQQGPSRCEIIFLCDLIQDDTLEIIQAHPLGSHWDIVKVQRLDRGMAGACNLGWQTARSRYVCYMHPDCYLPDDNALLRQVGWLEREGAVAVEPLIDIPQSDWDTMSFWDRVTSSQFRHAKPAHGLANKFDIIRRDVLEKIGGYDEVHFASAGEDADMVERLLAVGKVAFSDVIVIHAHLHPPSSRFSSTLRKHAQIGEGAGAMLRKHGLAWALARRALPITIVNSLKLGLLVGIFIPVPIISLTSLVLLLALATYYGRWAMLTRDWRAPLIPFAVAVMFSVYALSMVRAFIRGRQTFNYSKRPKK